LEEDEARREDGEPAGSSPGWSESKGRGRCQEDEPTIPRRREDGEQARLSRGRSESKGRGR